MRQLLLVAVVACGGTERPIANTASGSGDDRCEPPLAERPDYRLCAGGARLYELIRKDPTEPWRRGDSIPRGKLLDQSDALALIGGNCETADPASVCLFGRWHARETTHKSYAFPDTLAPRPGFPRNVLLAPYGRLLATNGANIGAIGLHAETWRVQPLDRSFAAGCDEPVLARPLARSKNGFEYELAISYRCGATTKTSTATIFLMEDANQWRIRWTHSP